MELIYLAVAVAVVFLCLFCFMKGVKVGRAIKEDKPLPNVVDLVKLDNSPSKEEKKRAEEFENWIGYQPKYTETRGNE